MGTFVGKYEEKRVKAEGKTSFALVPAAFFAVELFAFFFLAKDTDSSAARFWPLVFGILWAAMLGGFVRLLPRKGGRVLFAVLYFTAMAYAVVQTGYYILFSQMLWFSDFRYASEGSDYLDILLSYPISWWLGIAALVILGVALTVRFPHWGRQWQPRVTAAIAAAAAVVGACLLPEVVFQQDDEIRYAESDYGRAQSAEAAYDNMFNAHRLYQVCGLYQTLVKDLYANEIYPLTPAHTKAQAEASAQIDSYFAKQTSGGKNAMTGLLEGKNVILVLMESMDDWMIGEHTPTLCRLMEEGIHFTHFFTPAYGGIRTFNTEFCINTGSFLSSQGGYAFDYVTNDFDQSLANLLRERGYSAKEFHYNSDTFYSRGEFAPAMGYEEYVSYADYITDVSDKEAKQLLYDDQLLFDNPSLNDLFFREGKKLNFIITRSAHLSYKYNEVLSYWGLKNYPESKGLTGNEATDCAYLKARLVDDLFARMLAELEEKGELENTVIVGVTDHYTYGYKNEKALLELSGVDNKLLLERTPCFIWSSDLEPQTVDKVLNTADLLPTLLNLLGIDSEFSYMGHDAFDEGYDGFVPFSDGSWISGNTAYEAASKKLIPVDGGEASMDAQTRAELTQRTQAFTQINNLILQTDYYHTEEDAGED